MACMSTMSHAELVGIRYAMSALGKSRATVKRWAASGRLPATKLPGPLGQYVFERQDVDGLAQELHQ